MKIIHSKHEGQTVEEKVKCTTCRPEDYTEKEKRKSHVKKMRSLPKSNLKPPGDSL
jgi:hypothetical protein